MAQKRKYEESRPLRLPYVVTSDVSSNAAARTLQREFLDHIRYSLVREEHAVTDQDRFASLALAVRNRLIARWIAAREAYAERDVKRVSYLSMEFLMGRALRNCLLNLDIEDDARHALKELGFQLDRLEDAECDAGLGNGGLGRLAACFLDSLATLSIPAVGYGLRYEYGIFDQRIEDGYQVEMPDDWLKNGNPWEVPRPEYSYPVHFYGRVHQYQDEQGRLRNAWVDTQEVTATAYDTPIPGYRNDMVITLRLWSARAPRAFDLNHFNDGRYDKAVEQKSLAETITRVLYPPDHTPAGRELRLKQQYFFVAATLQDIIRTYKRTATTFDAFPDKHVIQLNDTHPTLAIPELMRILVDIEGLRWEEAWDITTRTFGYTNHTVLPEAMEQWPVELLGHVLPRHLQIIYEINHYFLRGIERGYPGDVERISRMSIISENGERRVRMAHLAVIGSHAVNGVARLHSRILRDEVFRDFYELWPDRFYSVTNGITPRRWLRQCNPGLAGLITEHIGDDWVTDLSALKRLMPLADDPEFQERWRKVKQANKRRLAGYIRKTCGVAVDEHMLFDCQVKRIHEYKRQLLNALHVLTLYRRLKANPGADIVPRTVIFAGKAAPGYLIAKLVIKLINAIADRVNEDPDAGDRLKVVFLPNYGVSLAEKIIPAADLSEQISTAGKEASGTGNMKLALNGALTIGTLDGANIEIREEVGEDNIFIFGLTAPEIRALRDKGYDPLAYYEEDEELRGTLDMIARGDLSPSEPDLFKPVVHALLHDGDPFMALADYASYVRCQERVSRTYRDQTTWTRMSILNCANMSRFSSDRTIQEYARLIWKVAPLPSLADEAQATNEASG